MFLAPRVQRIVHRKTMAQALFVADAQRGEPFRDGP
jgi:hypothetical protein